MSYWIVDRLLPGVVSSLIFAIPVWVSHVRLRRHVDTVTEHQSEHIDQLTADQTAALSSRKDPEKP